jgi:2-amino-4-hydroxy-6-hydroxymethyldihydropteridine diphosphokinase
LEEVIPLIIIKRIKKVIKEKIINASRDAKNDFRKLRMKAYFLAKPKNKDICSPKSRESMNKAYLLIGGNLGDRLNYLIEAEKKIVKFCGEILSRSSFYETAAWGNLDQPGFINRVLFIQTQLSAPDLMKKILEIEGEMGRKRLQQYGPRIIDIDILFFNEEIIFSKVLIIPHPQIQNRRFTLEPLNEIAPNLVHPLLHKTIRELLLLCEDKLDVKKLSIPDY